MLFAKSIIRSVVNPHDAPFGRVNSRRKAGRIDGDREAAVQSGLGEDLIGLGMIGRHNDQRIGMRIGKLESLF